MIEFQGDMRHLTCDALVVSTNGYVTKSGKCVMGRGIAKQISTEYPSLPKALGDKIHQYGNKVFLFDSFGHGHHKNLITFPVKAISEINTGNNVVRHMKGKFTKGELVAGWACKSRISIIGSSLKQLVSIVDDKGFKVVVCPRFGCGAGELLWKRDGVRELCEQYLDDRFVVCYL